MKGVLTSWMRLKPEDSTDYYYTPVKKPRRMVKLRRSALTYKIPIITTIAGATAAAIRSLQATPLM